MPVGFSSAARNLFLFGTTAGVVTNFFRAIDGAADPDTKIRPSSIQYNYGDQNLYVAGTAEVNSNDYGWIEKRDDDGSGTPTVDYDNKLFSTITNGDLVIRDIKLTDYESSVSDLVVCGRTGPSSGVVPFLAKYDSNGNLDWSVTSNTSGLEYFSVACDDSGYYVAGKTNDVDQIAYVEKFDNNGSPLWGKSGYMLGSDVQLASIGVNSRNQVIAAGQLSDESGLKGYILKLDSGGGSVLWDRTLRAYDTPEFSANDVAIEDLYVDGKDNIYIVGNIETLRGFVIKYSPEGNIIWQKEAPYNVFYNKVIADTDTGQVSAFGLYRKNGTNDQGGHITKFSENGDLVFRRTLFSNYLNPDSFGSTEVDGPPTSTDGILGEPGYSGLGFDATPSFYYMVFADGDPATNKRYTYGKLSGSGNGLGDFTYDDGSGFSIDYEIVGIGDFYLNVGDRIGRLQDGSLSNNSSDLASYPFTATKLLFDDLATQVTNKKRQMDSADSFEYSGSPVVRPADFQEMNLLGDAGISREPVGVVHSFDVTSTGGYVSNRGPDKGFDGDIDTFCEVLTSGKSVAWTPSFTIDTADEIFVYGRDSTHRLAVYGSLGDNTNIVPGTVDGVTNVYTVPTDLGILESMRVLGLTGAGFSAIKVGGEILVDAKGKWEDQSTRGNDAPLLVTDILKEPHPGFGSVRFDGADKYLSMPDSQLLELLDADFTVEFWIYPTGVPQGQYACIFAKGINIQCYFMNTNSISLFLDDNNSGSPYGVFENSNLTGTNSVPLHQWSHVAICRDNNTWKAFVNGVEKYSNVIPGLNPVFNSSDDFTIGTYGPQSTTYPFQGFISNFRLLKGTALYSADFTVPTTPLTSTGSDTSLLTCQGTGAIVDARTGTPNNITANGGAATTSLKTAPTYNDAGYWEFDGTDEIMTIGEMPGDFSEMTVEIWWKTHRLRNWDNPIDCNFEVTDANGVIQSGNIGPRLEINASGTLTWVWGASVDANDPKFSSIQTTVTTNQWYHSVFTIDGPDQTGGRAYLDGEFTGVQTATGTADWGQIGYIKNLILGRGFALSGDRFFDGEIGEVRIYPRALTAAAVFQNYNATKSKYINEAPVTAPKIGSDIVYDNTRLILNFDFANRATYDNVNNLLPYSADIRNSQTNWARAGVDIVATDLKGPFGESGVVGLVEQTNNGQHTLYDDMPYVYYEGNYTSSCWIKPGIRSYAEIFVNGAGVGQGLQTVTGAFRFNFNDGTVTNVGDTSPGVMFTEGPDGWWFCGIKSIIEGSTAVPGQSGTYRFHVRPATASTADYQGDDSAPAIYIIHPQVSDESGLQKAGDLSQRMRYVPTYNGAIQSTTVNNLCGSPGYNKPGPGTISGPVFDSDGYFKFGQSTTSGITGPFDYDDVTYQDFTVEAWIWGNNWNGNGDSYSGILNRSDGTNHIFSTFINSSGEMASWFYTQGGAIQPNTSSSDGDPALTLSVSTWNHCVWVHNEGAGMEYYLNNSAASMYSNTNDRRKDNSNQTFTIGKWNQNQYELIGRIGEIRFYNRKLFASEISQNFNATRGKYGV